MLCYLSSNIPIRFHYYLHFTDEKTEANQGCTVSNGWTQNFNSGKLNLQSIFFPKQCY